MLHITNRMHNGLLTAVVSAATFFVCLFAHAQQTGKDNSLIDQYITSMGYTKTIVFDASNIKQFWIDNSVLSQDSSILISLNRQNGQNSKSVPLKIRLANVVETQDCKIDIFTEDPAISFSVLNSRSAVLSNSASQEDFIHYHIISSTFHLEDLQDFSFNLVFSSDKADLIAVKKIVLSFSENKESRFLGSPGYDQLSMEIENNGIRVPDTDVKYIVSKEYSKVFVMIPDDIAKDNRYFYHIYPRSTEDLAETSKFGFNNVDSLLNQRDNIIPKNYSSKSKYTIIQVLFPSYPFTSLDFGQYNSSNRPWQIILKDETL